MKSFGLKFPIIGFVALAACTHNETKEAYYPAQFSRQVASVASEANQAEAKKMAEEFAKARDYVKKNPVVNAPEEPEIKDCDHVGHPGVCAETELEQWYENLSASDKEKIKKNEYRATAVNMASADLKLERTFRRLLKKYHGNAMVISGLKQNEEDYFVKRNHECVNADASYGSGMYDQDNVVNPIWNCSYQDDESQNHYLTMDGNDAPWHGGIKPAKAYPLKLSQTGLAEMYQNLSPDPQNANRVIGIIGCPSKKTSVATTCQVEAANHIIFQDGGNTWPRMANGDGVLLNFSAEDQAAMADRHNAFKDEGVGYWDYVACSKSSSNNYTCQINQMRITNYGEFFGWSPNL